MFGVLKLGKLGASMKKAGFNPSTLFAASEPGAWYDPSDMSTLFQDSAGTVPVTAVEQPVGRILDKSGRGNHAIQATTTKRPVLQQDGNGKYYLAFDGVDDSMATAAINFTATDKMTVWAGMTNLGAGESELYGLSMDPIANPSVMLRPTGGGGVSGNVYAYSRGSGGLVAAGVEGAGVPPVNLVTTAESSISAPYVRLRIDSVLRSQTNANQGIGTYGNSPLYIGGRSGLGYFFNGRLYSLIMRGAQTPLSQIEATERYIKQKMGLP